MSQDTLIAEVLKVDARALKMPGVARNHEPLARQALEERWTHQEYLHEVLSAEVSSQLDSAIRERIRKAGFPEQKALGDFDFSVVEGVTPAAISDLARCDWVRKAGNVVMVVRSGREQFTWRSPWVSKRLGRNSTWSSGGRRTW